MKSLITATACALAALAGTFASAHTGERPKYDIVIRNGRVLDGAGNPWVRADVAVRGGRIVAVGVVPQKGKTEIDAAGKFVAPGWINSMDQSGDVLRRQGLAANKLLMGVTTVIAGEGGTPVPAAEISRYFASLEKQGIGVNFATYYSATQARVEVIGDSARAPSADELTDMKTRIDTAMRAGALGISTALIYPPGAYQSTEELIELAKAAAPYGAIYATHMRDEGVRLGDAISEAIEIGEKGGVKVEIFHLKAAYKPMWGALMEEAGALIDAARARGLDIAADLYPYTAGGTGLEIALPLEVFADGLDAAIEKLKDKEYRADLIKRIENEEFGEWSRINLVVASGGWDGVVLANAFKPPYQQYQYRSIADIAAELNVNPYDLVIDIMLNALPNRAFAFYHMIGEQDVRTALQFPWTSIGTDAAAVEELGGVDDLGLPHPRSYGTFPRILAKYVRDEHVLTLEEAVRKMTSWPASRHGFEDRGVIREGLWADIVVFDADKVQDNATWENGTATPTGIDYVLVNGVVAVREGVLTGAKAGRVLRGDGAQ